MSTQCRSHARFTREGHVKGHLDIKYSKLGELEGVFTRKQAKGKKQRGEKQAEIEIFLVDENKKKWRIKTIVKEWKKLIIERVSQAFSGSCNVVSYLKSE